MDIKEKIKEEGEIILEEMKRRRDALNIGIAAVEKGLAEPPYVGNIDSELIKMMAEHHIVQLDIWERKREKGGKNLGKPGRGRRN